MSQVHIPYTHTLVSPFLQVKTIQCRHVDGFNKNQRAHREPVGESAFVHTAHCFRVLACREVTGGHRGCGKVFHQGYSAVTLMLYCIAAADSDRTVASHTSADGQLHFNEANTMKRPQEAHTSRTNFFPYQIKKNRHPVSTFIHLYILISMGKWSVQNHISDQQKRFQKRHPAHFQPTLSCKHDTTITKQRSKMTQNVFNYGDDL